MAYITTEQVAEKREALKIAFPSKDGWKISVRREHSSSIIVAIMEAPLDFSLLCNHGKGYQQVNNSYITDHYGENFPKHAEALEKINDIMNKGNYNNSDIMTDYFDVGFYTNLHIGKWDVPFVFKGTTPEPTPEVTPEPTPETETPQVEAANIQVVDYSEKAVVITGEGTKKIKEKLKEIGAKPNWNLRDIGFGWIFPKSKIELLKQTLTAAASY